MQNWIQRFDELLKDPPEDSYTILAEAFGIVRENERGERLLNTELLEAQYGVASSGERTMLACAVSMWSRDFNPSLTAEYPARISDITTLDTENRYRLYKAIEATQG